MVEERFSKKNRICLKDEIDLLFQEGKKIHVFPLLSHVLIQKNDAPNFSVLISVPKKRIKKAHDRNRIKRLIREAIRKNKHPLIKKTFEEGCRVQFSIVYLWDEIAEYANLELQIQQLITKICAQKPV